MTKGRNLDKTEGTVGPVIEDWKEESWVYISRPGLGGTRRDEEGRGGTTHSPDVSQRKGWSSKRRVSYEGTTTRFGGRDGTKNRHQESWYSGGHVEVLRTVVGHPPTTFPVSPKKVCGGGEWWVVDFTVVRSRSHSEVNIVIGTP